MCSYRPAARVSRGAMSRLAYATETWSACAAASSRAIASSPKVPTTCSLRRPPVDCRLKGTCTEVIMKRLIHWSVEHHWIVITLSLLLLAAGAWTARDMPVDVFPDLTAPTVTILAEGHGMAPEEMESLVTFPIESAINGASGVRRVRAATAVGVGVIWVEFDWGTDIYIARQLVAEKLALVAGTLPPQIERPVLAPISSIMGEILFFAISSETQDALALRTLADTVVRRRLLALPGVSQVTPIGGSERQYQVLAHAEAMRANAISLTELLDAARGASENSSAGIYTEGSQEYVLEAIGRVRSVGEL